MDGIKRFPARKLFPQELGAARPEPLESIDAGAGERKEGISLGTARPEALESIDEQSRTNLSAAVGRRTVLRTTPLHRFPRHGQSGRFICYNNRQIHFCQQPGCLRPDGHGRNPSTEKITSTARSPRLNPSNVSKGRGCGGKRGDDGKFPGASSKRKDGKFQWSSQLQMQTAQFTQFRPGSPGYLATEKCLSSGSTQ